MEDYIFVWFIYFGAIPFLIVAFNIREWYYSKPVVLTPEEEANKTTFLSFIIGSVILSAMLGSTFVMAPAQFYHTPNGDLGVQKIANMLLTALYAAPGLIAVLAIVNSNDRATITDTGKTIGHHYMILGLPLLISAVAAQQFLTWIINHVPS